MEQITISELKARATGGVVEAEVRGQVEEFKERKTKAGGKYYELKLRDATELLVLKIWDNHPDFSRVEQIVPGLFFRAGGTWEVGNYGLEGRDWRLDALAESEIDALFTGASGGEFAERQLRDYQFVIDQVEEMSDPRLKKLCEEFLNEFGERFRRTAAARRNHHARRGGLVEHVAQMMRTAIAVSSAYPELNRDLILAGVLFHDAGKLWENSFPSRGFQMDFDLHGELLGHIPIGLELVNRLWRGIIESGQSDGWKDLEPDSDLVRLHLLHLIASHHGEYEYGAPVLPKTPEALVLHHVDNIDAKMEMFRRGYLEQPELGPGIQSRAFPLPGNLVRPLPAFGSAEEKITPPPEDPM